jgi:hypothetical protein
MSGIGGGNGIQTKSPGGGTGIGGDLFKGGKINPQQKIINGKKLIKTK